MSLVPLQARRCTAECCGTQSRTWTQPTSCSWRRCTCVQDGMDTCPSSIPRGLCTTRALSTAASRPTNSSNTGSWSWYVYLLRWERGQASYVFTMSALELPILIQVFWQSVPSIHLYDGIVSIQLPLSSCSGWRSWWCSRLSCFFFSQSALHISEDVHVTWMCFLRCFKTLLISANCL